MAADEKDPSHWLLRLSVDEWLSAAETELAHCAAALARRAVRPGVTHARRAAGMAWNAVLVQHPEARQADRYGRSYMEHVLALAGDESAPPEVRTAAGLLRDTPPAPAELLILGKPDLKALHAAQLLVAHARSRTQGH